MTRVRVESFTISLDGYGAGPDQSVNDPLGVGSEALHDWMISTRTWLQMHGKEGGTRGIDDDFAARGVKEFGAWILGRNMFGPIRGPWPDMNWKGWWGDNPPYHVPVFILTHHARPPIQMKGNTTYHFVTGGIHEALDQARKAADGMDVRIGGGPIPYSSIFVRAWSMSCTSQSRRFCSAEESDCSRRSTCDPRDTNACSSWGRRRPLRLYSGARRSDAPVIS
jgi:dihydrofolate reductase